MNAIGGTFPRSSGIPRSDGGAQAAGGPLQFSGGALTANPDLIKECANRFSVGRQDGHGDAASSSPFAALFQNMAGGAAGRLASNHAA